MSTPEQPAASEPVPPFRWPTGRGVPPGPTAAGTSASYGPSTSSPSGAPVYGTPPPASGAAARPEVPASRVPQPRGRSGRAARAGAGLAAGAGGLAKVGVLAKLFGALKLLHLAGQLKFALSMVTSIALYAVFWGWRYAVGFVLLMLVHELGHVVELRRQGVRTTAVMFVPFLGAYTAHEGTGTPRDEATAAFAGPLAGTVAATGVLYLGQVSQSQLLLALAYSGFFLNLLNLLPVPPLDGGRVAGALHPALWVAGLAVGVWYVVAHRPNPVLILVLGLGVWHVVGVLRGRAGRRAHLEVPAQERALIAGAYVLLALWCVWGMHVAYVVPPR